MPASNPVTAEMAVKQPVPGSAAAALNVHVIADGDPGTTWLAMNTQDRLPPRVCTSDRILVNVMPFADAVAVTLVSTVPAQAPWKHNTSPATGVNELEA